MKIRRGDLALIIIIGLIGLSISHNRYKYVQKVANTNLVQNQYYLDNERQCYQFIEQQFLTEKGYIKEQLTMNANKKIEKEIITLKTQNIYLLYLLNKGKKKEFEKSFNYIKRHFILQEGVVAEKIIDGQLLGTSSTGDALELIKICILAYEKWEEPKYRDLALQIETGIYQYGIQNQRFYGYYLKNENIEEDINLVEVNLNTIKLLTHYRKEWEKVYDNMYIMIEANYINSVFPFYRTNYNTKSIDNKEQIAMKDTLQIVLYLAEINVYKPQTIEWLKEHLKKEGLFERYDIKTGLAVTNQIAIENYALIAQIGRCIDDIELYTLGIEHMLKFQLDDSYIKYKGAFSLDSKKEISSQLNLECLRAF